MTGKVADIGQKRLAQVLKIKFRSYNANLLDQSVIAVVNAVKKTGVVAVGPIPIPNESYVFTVSKSPHVFGKSREKLVLTKHCRMLMLLDANSAVIEAISAINLHSGVGIKIEVINASN